MPIEVKYPTRTAGISKSIRLDNNTNVAIETVKKLVDNELDKYYIEEKITTSLLMKEMIRLSFTSDTPIISIEDKKYTIKDLVENHFGEKLKIVNILDYFDNRENFIEWFIDILKITDREFMLNVKNQRDICKPESIKYQKLNELYIKLTNGYYDRFSNQKFKGYSQNVDMTILRAQYLICNTKEVTDVPTKYWEVFRQTLMDSYIFSSMSIVSMVNTLQYGILINQFNQINNYLYEVIDNYGFKEDFDTSLKCIESICKKEFNIATNVIDEDKNFMPLEDVDEINGLLINDIGELY